MIPGAARAVRHIRTDDAGQLHSQSEAQDGRRIDDDAKREGFQAKSGVLARSNVLGKLPRLPLAGDLSGQAQHGVRGD